MVGGASGPRSNRQAGSERAEYEPALPRVRGAELAASALAGGCVRGQRARLPPQQQQPRAQRMRRLRRQDCRKVPPARPRQILAPRMPQVHVLWPGTSGHGQIVLFQRRHDIMQKRLYEVCTLFFTHKSQCQTLSCIVLKYSPYPKRMSSNKRNERSGTGCQLVLD